MPLMWVSSQQHTCETAVYERKDQLGMPKLKNSLRNYVYGFSAIILSLEIKWILPFRW